MWRPVATIGLLLPVWQAETARWLLANSLEIGSRTMITWASGHRNQPARPRQPSQRQGGERRASRQGRCQGWRSLLDAALRSNTLVQYKQDPWVRKKRLKLSRAPADCRRNSWSDFGTTKRCGPRCAAVQRTRKRPDILELKQATSSRTLASFIWQDISVKNCTSIVHETTRRPLGLSRLLTYCAMSMIPDVPYDWLYFWSLWFLCSWIAACWLWAGKNKDSFHKAATDVDAR